MVSVVLGGGFVPGSVVTIFLARRAMVSGLRALRKRGWDEHNVLVVGDAMLDHFMIGKVSRISPEAPVPVVEFEREFSLPGGAANVAHNVRALGARVWLVAVVGDHPPAAAENVRTDGCTVFVLHRSRPGNGVRIIRA